MVTKMERPNFNTRKTRFEELVSLGVYDLNKSLKENSNNLVAHCTAIEFLGISRYVQREMMPKPNFLLEDIMKEKGFYLYSKDATDSYYEYHNNGTVHYNIDYNQRFPEPKDKVIINISFKYGEFPYVSITQDGGTRKVYAGVVYNEVFFDQLLYSIR